MAERLQIEKRQIIGLGVAAIPSSRWQECGPGVIFELTDEEEARKQILGQSYIERLSINDEGLEVIFRVRFNPEDTDFPPIYAFDTQSVVLKNPEKIDRLFRPGCALGKKTVFRRKI